MSDAISLIKAVVREEIRAIRIAELGIVTASYPHEADTDSNNYECDVRLRESGLELRRVPVATSRIGLVAIPNVDDLVLVQFLGGDPHAAVITGRLYNDADRPPVAATGEHVYVSRDPAEAGVRRFVVELPNGNSLTLDDDQVVVAMGDTTLTIDNGGDAVLTSAARVVIEAAGDTTVAAGGNLDLEASGDVTMSGVNITINASANARLEGSAGATVKAAAITLAGKTDFSPA